MLKTTVVETLNLDPLLVVRFDFSLSGVAPAQHDWPEDASHRDRKDARDYLYGRLEDLAEGYRIGADHYMTLQLRQWIKAERP